MICEERRPFHPTTTQNQSMINKPIPPKPSGAPPASPLARFWLRLTAPSSAIQNNEHRRQAQFLAALLVFLLPFFFLPETIRTLLNGEAPVYLGSASISLSIAYYLSRTRHFKWGVVLTLATFLLIPFTVTLSPAYNPDQLINTIIWTAPTLIMGGLLLAFQSALALIIANAAVMLALPLLVSGITYSHLTFPLSFTFVLSTLILVAVKAHENDIRFIRDQKQALSHNNAYLQNILESITTPFYIINIDDYSIELANSAARELGIDAYGPAATCYKLTHRRDTPCDGAEHPCPLATIRNTRQPTTVEHIHFNKDGQPRTVEVHGYPILDENGNVKQMIEYSIDITRRREAEENVRKLSRAVEQSANAIVVTNLNGIIEYVNPGFSRITGYTPQEAIGQHTRMLKSGYHSQEFYAKLWGSLSRGEVWQGEMVNRKKNGEHYWEFATMSPVKDEQGHITHYLAIKEDITRQMEAEQTIRKLSRAVEQSGSSIVITDLEGTIEYVNPAFTRVTGYTPEEAIGQNPRVLKSDKQPPELYTELWQTITRGDVWQGELINKKKNGEHYWELATISPVKNEDGVTTHYLAIKDDITLRKQVEAALEQREEDLRTLMEQTPVGIMTLDKNGVITSANPQCLQLLGSPSIFSTVGLNILDLPDIASTQLDEGFKHVLETKQPVDGASWYTSLWGKTLFLHSRLAPHFDSQGNLIGVIQILEDLTHRKQAEEALAEAHKQAQEASQLKTQLLANVSHDMRTPLGSILGYTEMLQAGIYGDLSQEQMKATTNIIDSGSQMLLFINDLINQAQLDSGKVVLNMQPFAPASLLDTIYATVGALAQAKSLQLISEVAPDLPAMLVGDSYWLRQILTNLVSNAVKFTEAGYVKTRLYRVNEAHWAMEVSDTGQGIAENDQLYIFDAFRQVDGAATKKQGIGSGLGLSIVNQLTAMMDGRIALTSEEGKGSAFTILLPIVLKSEAEKVIV